MMLVIALVLSQTDILILNYESLVENLDLYSVKLDEFLCLSTKSSASLDSISKVLLADFIWLDFCMLVSLLIIGQK